MRPDPLRQRPISVALTDAALHNEFAALEREQTPNRAAAFPLGIKPKEATPPPSATPLIPRNDSKGLRVRAVASTSGSSMSTNTNPSSSSRGVCESSTANRLLPLSESSPPALPSGLQPPAIRNGGGRHAVEEDDAADDDAADDDALSLPEGVPHLTMSGVTVSGGVVLQRGHKAELTKFRGGKHPVRRRRSILPLDPSSSSSSSSSFSSSFSSSGIPQCASSPSIFISQPPFLSSPHVSPSSSSPSVTPSDHIQIQVQVHLTTKSEYSEHESPLTPCSSLPVVVSIPTSSSSSSSSANPKILASSVSTHDLQNMRLKKLPLWDVRRTPGLSESLTAGRVLESSSSSSSAAHPSEISPLHLAGYQLMSFPDNLPDVDRSTAMITHLHPMQYYEKYRTVSDETFIFTFMRRHDLTFEQKKDEFGHLNQSLSRMGIEKIGPTERIPASSLIILGNRVTGIPYVKSGTINSLFRMLCDDLSRLANPYSLLEATLFLTYPLFSSTELVLSTFGYLVASFLQSRKNSKELKCVGDALYHWAGLIPEDFDGSPEGSENLKKLAFLLSQCHATPIVPLSFVERNRQYIHRVRSVAIPPSPLLPMNLRGGIQSLHLLVLDPLEVARQMSLRSFSLFEQISPREWLNTSHVDSDHISLMSKDFNFLANFFAEAILDSSDVIVRADVIARSIMIAEASLKMRNFHTYMAILCSLNSAAISRLQKTWKVFKKNKELYSKYLELEALGEMDNNFQNLREVCQITPDIPSIPYLGLFLSDITFIIDGNRNVPVPLDHINFEMIQMIGEIQLKIRVMQSTPYNFEAVPFIQDYIYERNVTDGNRLYDYSLKHEPRVTKEALAPPKTKKSFSRRMSLFFTQNEMETKLKKFAEENRESISFASSVPRDSSVLSASYECSLTSPNSSSSSSTSLSSSSPSLSSPSAPSPSASSFAPPGLTINEIPIPSIPPQDTPSPNEEDKEETQEEEEEVEETASPVRREDNPMVQGLPPPLAKGMRPKRKLGRPPAN